MHKISIKMSTKVEVAIRRGNVYTKIAEKSDSGNLSIVRGKTDEDK